MKKKFVAVVIATVAVIFGSLTSPVHADSQWATGLAWSQLHVKSEAGVFESWKRVWDWKDKNSPFDQAHILVNSPLQHATAFVRMPQNSFTATYNGGVSQANKLVRFTFQGYDIDFSPMGFNLQPEATASPSASPSYFPAPKIRVINTFPTYYNDATVTTDDNGYAAITVSLLNTKTHKVPNEGDQINFNVQTLVGQSDATVGTPTKPAKGKVSTVNVSYRSIDTAAIYEYSLDGGTTWLPTYTSSFKLTASTVTQGVKIRGFNAVGQEIVTWHPAGWRPVIKLVGTATGKQCDPYANVPSKYLCNDIDFKDQTFDWSVVSGSDRGWFRENPLYDYAQAYAKSYLAGSTMSLRFYAHDIWGTPEKKLPLSMSIDGGLWTFKDTITTDNSGYANFTAKNKNTAAAIKKLTYINPDNSKLKIGGTLGFVVRASSDNEDEVTDLMWFFLTGDSFNDKGCPNSLNQLKCPEGQIQVPIWKRGANTTNRFGNAVVDNVTNPALTLDGSGTQTLNDVVIADVNFKGDGTANNVVTPLGAPLYAPDVTVTATNGGLASLATAQQVSDGYADFNDLSKFSATVKFGFSHYQNLVLVGTKAGLTTWTITAGTWTYSITQNYVAAP